MGMLEIQDTGGWKSKAHSVPDNHPNKCTGRRRAKVISFFFNSEVTAAAATVPRFQLKLIAGLAHLCLL